MVEPLFPCHLFLCPYSFVPYSFPPTLLPLLVIDLSSQPLVRRSDRKAFSAIPLLTTYLGDHYVQRRHRKASRATFGRDAVVEMFAHLADYPECDCRERSIVNSRDLFVAGGLHLRMYRLRPEEPHRLVVRRCGSSGS